MNKKYLYTKVLQKHTNVMYYSVFEACLERICNVHSVYQRTWLISHTSAYVGAIRRSVTGPLHNNGRIMNRD